jgi:hypothetical protein
MLRRRLTRLGRMAVQVSGDCQGDDLGMPLVFASRYGDVVRSLELLRELDAQGDLSPAGFSMSVHNAISGMYSIARSDSAAAVCVAAGQASAAAGLIEAAGLLADGAPEVLLVAYDEPLPAPYEDFADDAACSWAWAWRVALPRTDDADVLRLRMDAEEGDEAGAATREELPFGLDLLRLLLTRAPRLTRRVEGRCYSIEHLAGTGHA